MTNAENTKIVQDAYAAFGRGDIQALLATMADDIVWSPVVGAGSHVPTAGERHGKAAVAEFFTILAKSLTFSRFEPQEFVAQADTVVAIGHYAAATPNGKTIDSDFVMIFTLRDGKLVRFREFADSAALNAAY